MTNFKSWIKCAGIRAIKTVIQTAVATLGTSAVLSEVDFSMVLSASILAGLLSLLTSISGLPELDADTIETTTTTEVNVDEEVAIEFTTEEIIAEEETITSDDITD